MTTQLLRTLTAPSHGIQTKSAHTHVIHSATGPAASRVGAHIPSLDGLRAISFAIVFAAHAGLERWVPGGFGVTVFFFLSGFLITTLLRGEYDHSGRISVRSFYLRRVLRILPPFYTVLAIATTLCALGWVGGELNLGAVAAQFLHFANYWIVGHGYSGQALGTGVYWSLAVEEHYYLLFPLLYILLRRTRTTNRQQALVLYGLCILALVWRCWLVLGHGASADRTYLASDTRFDSILFGAALAVGANPVLDSSPPRQPWVWKWVVVPACILLIGFTFLFRNDVFRATFRYTLQGVALTPLFICAIRFRHWLPFRILNLPIVAFVGTLSYSLYLIHHVVIFAIQQHFPNLGTVLQAVAALALSVAAAWIIYRTIEVPCAQLRKRLEKMPVRLP
jgi:peptidoglycan/LPS O-acetylase OafA/YrhL